MRIGLYTFTSGHRDKVVDRAATVLAPALRKLPGFIAYDIVVTGPDSGISLTTWETPGQADAAVGLLADWVRSEVPDAVKSVTNHIGELVFSTRGN